MTIIEIIHERVEEPFDEATPLGALGLDSLEILELLQHVEEKSGINIPLHDYPKLHTVGDVIHAASQPPN